MALAHTLDHAPPRTLARWEPCIAGLCLVQCSEPFFNAVAQGQGLTEAPGYARLAWAPVYLFLGYVIVRDWRQAAGAVWRMPLLMALLALAFASMLWSIDPGATVRRAVWLMLSMAFALYLAWRNDWMQLFRVCAIAWGVMIAGSIVLSVVTPSIGVNTVTHPGAWNGLWTHKNTLGGIMAVGVPIMLAGALATKQRYFYALAAGAFLLVLMSTSKTSLLASLLGVSVLMAGVVARRGPFQALVVIFGAAFAAILGASVMLMAPELLVSLIGRDLTFTGRTDIWHAAETAVAARPWFGYGYGAFWLDPNGPVFYLRETVQWDVPSAHNGWLELALGVGQVGIALFALHYAVTAFRAVRALGSAPRGLWPAAFCAAFALYTMSESHILEANNIFWALYVIVATRLALDAAQPKEIA
jgi:exopolysaccharide production protein ExoQ